MTFLPLIAATATAEPRDRPPAETVAVVGTVVGGGWLDGDHDGVDDLAVGTSGSPVLQVFTRGTSADPIEVALPSGDGDVRHLAIGKDPDGATFVVVSFEDTALGTFHVVRATWTASGFSVDWTEEGITDANLAGDVDGDGHTDVWTSIGGLRLSGGDTTSPVPTVVHDDSLANVQSVGDVDGDGFADLLGSFVSPDLEIGYQPIGGHAGLYRGTPTGIDPDPLWELASADMPIPDLRVGGSAVGLGEGRIAFTLRRADEGGCDGADWIAVITDADTDTPFVAQVIDVPIDLDCKPTQLVWDAPNGDPTVVAYGDWGLHWRRWDAVVGWLAVEPHAVWIPDEPTLSWLPPLTTEPLAFVLNGSPQSVAVWTLLHVGPDPEVPPPEEPPPSGPPPEVDEQLVVVSTPEGTTCWCAVNPVSGGAGVWLAALAVRRARRRPTAGRSTP